MCIRHSDVCQVAMGILIPYMLHQLAKVVMTKVENRNSATSPDNQETWFCRTEAHHHRDDEKRTTPGVTGNITDKDFRVKTATLPIWHYGHGWNKFLVDEKHPQWVQPSTTIHRRQLFWKNTRYNVCIKMLCPF